MFLSRPEKNKLMYHQLSTNLKLKEITSMITFQEQKILQEDHRSIGFEESIQL